MAEFIEKTDTLNEGREKINAAIQNAEDAKNISVEADEKATQALANSESTQTQLNTIVIEGDSSVEAAQARVDEKGQTHATLKDRIDDGFTKVNAQLAEKASQSWVEDELNRTTYYDKYTITKNYDPVSETEYWITEIVTDSNTPLYFDVTKGDKGQTVREYAIEHNTTISINGSTMETDSAGNIMPSGVTIINGEVITDEPSSFQWRVGLTHDNRLVFFSPEKTSQEIFNEEPNIKDVLTAFTPLIIDGEAASPDILRDGINYDERHPRQVIGQKANGNILFFTTGGRGYGGNGMLASDCIRILQNIGCEKAFMLDGGGSTSLVEKGVFINYRIDGLGTRERKRPTTINLGAVGNRPYMYDIRDLFSRISDIEARLYAFERPQLVDDLDEITISGFYWALQSSNGVPNDGENSWAVIHFQLGSDRFQVAFPFRTAITLEGTVFIRRTFPSGWSGWRNTSEIRRINNLTIDTAYKDIPTGYFHNWASGWNIGGQSMNGFVVTEKAYGYEYRSCIQMFYPSIGYDVYYRKPISDTEWSDWYKYTGENIGK